MPRLRREQVIRSRIIAGLAGAKRGRERSVRSLGTITGSPDDPGHSPILIKRPWDELQRQKIIVSRILEVVLWRQ